MDRKTRNHVIKFAKQFIVVVDSMFGTVGVRIIKKIVDDWMAHVSRKAKVARPRARGKKS